MAIAKDEELTTRATLSRFRIWTLEEQGTQEAIQRAEALKQKLEKE